MKLFVVTCRGRYATQTEIVRAESEADIPPLTEDTWPWTSQKIEEIVPEGDAKVLYSNSYIE